MGRIEDTLEADLKELFFVKNVSFTEPSSAKEQGTLFVTIDNSRHNIKDTEEVARLSGTCLIFADADKIPSGFFSKAIKNASRAIQAKFHFSDLEQSEKIYGKIMQRSFSFVYFYRTQYDPDKGTITSVEFTEDE